MLKNMADKKKGLRVDEIVDFSIGMIVISIMFFARFFEEERVSQRIYMSILYIAAWILVIFIAKKSSE